MDHRISAQQKALDVVSHFMGVQKSIIILLFASLILSCGRNTKAGSTDIEIKEVTVSDIVDEVEPPPPVLTSKFKTLQEWLFSICDEEKPEKSIENYNFGLFESSDGNTIYLVGVNKYDKSGTSHTRIEFKPSNMYFKLPYSEYKSLSRDQLLNKLMVQLKAFASTEKFKASFMSKSNAITLEPNRVNFWSK